MNYDEEIEEFAKMEESIKDIDWYKAETQAARNGHEAAMKFATDKTAESNAWQTKYHEMSDEVAGLKQDIEKLVNWLVTVLVIIAVSFFVGMLIGGWIF